MSDVLDNTVNDKGITEFLKIKKKPLDIYSVKAVKLTQPKRSSYKYDLTLGIDKEGFYVSKKVNNSSSYSRPKTTKMRYDNQDKLLEFVVDNMKKLDKKTYLANLGKSLDKAVGVKKKTPAKRKTTNTNRRRRTSTNRDYGGLWD